MPVYTCKSKYTALIANLGSFVRGRKRTAPSAYAGYLDFDDNTPSKGSLISSLARSKSQLFMLCEASEINDGERRFLHERGWMNLSNRYGDILIGSRVNDVESSMKRLAGSTLVGVAHEALPCSYMIVEIIYGKTLKVGLQGNRDDFPKASLQTTLTRAGSDRIRVCMFHLNSGVAGDKVALAHEALGAMYADCLHYQVDLVGGEANMALYRATGRKQESMDIREECTRVSGTTSLKPGLKLHRLRTCASQGYNTFLQTVCAFSSSMRMLSVAHPIKSALLRIGVHSLVSILWWHLFSNGAIAWTMTLGPIFLLGNRNSR